MIPHNISPVNTTLKIQHCSSFTIERIIILINTLKHATIKTVKDHSFTSGSLKPIFDRTGSAQSKPMVLPTYFVRRIGISQPNESVIINEYLTKLAQHQIKHQLITTKLKFDSNYSKITQLKSAFEKVNETFSNIDQFVISTAQNQLMLIKFSDKIAEGTFVNAVTTTLKLFISSDKNINKSKLLNFTIKLFYWLDTTFSKLIGNHDYKDIKMTNSKIIYCGDISKHETYLLYCLYQMGIDVLYMNSVSDSLIQTNPLLSNCSVKETLTLVQQQHTYTLPNTATQSAPAKPKQPRQANVQKKTTNSVVDNYNKRTKPAKSVEFTSEIVIKKREFKGDLNEVLAKTNERIGYLGLPSVILPTYFIRYIGISNNPDVYSNTLFNADRLLNKEAYIKIENRIPIGNTTDLMEQSKSIWGQGVYTKNNIHDILCKLNGTDALKFINSPLLKTQVLAALEITITMLFEDQNQIPSSKIKNIVIKLLSWFEAIYKDVFSNYNYTGEKIPKILYFGDIKAHEGLFLTFIFHLGVDVIYINTYQDNIFENIDEDLNFSSLHVNETLDENFKFPTKEVMIRQSTIAYQASAEIDQIIHNDQDGVYKPWQFEKYQLMPITLRTTYDEFFILWLEESRVRTGFKVVDKTVYVPNLFVKICGTNEVVDDYFRFVSSLTNQPHSLMINELPFPKPNISKADVYRLANAIEKNGKIHVENIKKNPLYKLAYLDDALQNKIIWGIEQLFELKVLKVDMDMNTKLLVLATIITMDKTILELLQNFDYPFAVPKLIVYDSKESMFSFEDSVLLSFLYINGFDICVLTPSGYNNFESHVEERFFDKFKLESKQFNLALPDLNNYKEKKQKSFWSNIFG